MQLAVLVLKLGLFLLVVAFAVKNTDPVTVRYYFGGEWQGPLVFVMLIAFCAGVAAGLAAGAGPIVRQRREIAGLRREIEARRSRGARDEAVAPSDAV